MTGSARVRTGQEEGTVANTDDREAQVDEKDVEAHSTIDSPGTIDSTIDRTDDDDDDVEGHALIDAPGVVDSTVD
jgi:hypothetical protein